MNGYGGENPKVLQKYLRYGIECSNFDNLRALSISRPLKLEQLIALIGRANAV